MLRVSAFLLAAVFLFASGIGQPRLIRNANADDPTSEKRSTASFETKPESNSDAKSNEKSDDSNDRSSVTGRWVAVGYGGRRMVSGDGKSWEITSEWAQPGGDDSNNLTDVVHAFGKFVAVGGGGVGDESAGHILTSPDGRTWKEVQRVRGRVNPIVFGDGRLVAGAHGSQFLWSTDGERWFTGSRIAAPFVSHFRYGAYGNGVFVFVGNSGGMSGPFWSVTTEKGKRLLSIEVGLPALRGLAFGNGKFVAVGENGSRLVSTDGRKWTNHRASLSENFKWIQWTGKRFLAGGNFIYSSQDGESWDKLEAGYRGILLWANDEFFVRTIWPGKMLYSTDGSNWENCPELSANGINKVVVAR